jgi:DHA2 family lincomycin resistance protein-like MFS transporter
VCYKSTPKEDKLLSTQQASRPQVSKYVIVAAAFAAFLATFNETFLNVAFTPIGEDLGVGVDTVQWLATAYMLAAAVMVPIAAFAYRTFHTRNLYCATVAFLIVGSVIGFLAPNFEVLLIGRVVQAIGTGMLIPLNMAITLDTAPREKLGAYMGIMGSMTTLGPSLSVILAGVLLSFFVWRALLLVFGLLSCLCLIIGAVVLRDVTEITKPKLDVPSVIFVGIGLICLLYGISSIFSGSVPFAVAAIIVGVVFLAAFALRQGKIENPLVDLRPLAIPAFTIGVLLNMIALIVMFAMNIITPIYLQSILGQSSLMASLALFPAIALSAVVSPLAGKIYDKSGPRVLLPAGFACIAVFSIMLALFIGTGNILLIAILYIPIICGCALVIGPVQSFALSRLSWELNPHGTTVMSVGFQVAGALGSSLFTGLYYMALSNSMASGATLVSAGTDAFLVVGIAGACFGVVAIVLALIEGRFSKQVVTAATPDWNAEGAESEEGSASDWDQATSSASVATKTAPTLRDVMKSDVYTLPQSAHIADALEMFVERGISGAPIVDAHNKVVGFISDGDVMAQIADQVPAFKSAWSFIVERENADFDRTVREAMARNVMEVATKNVICVNENDDLGAVSRVLAERHLKKVPVVDAAGRMIGIVNRSNITSYAVRQFKETI